jgi:hypothetical protein
VDGAIAACKEALRLSPKDVRSHIALASALARREPTAALRVMREAAETHPTWLTDPNTGIRYNLACYACLAATGAGKNPAPEAARPRLRKEALDWLNADLDAWRKQLTANPKSRLAQQKMQHWLTDADLASVRDLENLPAAEREGWRKFWAEVRRLRDATASPEKT